MHTPTESSAPVSSARPSLGLRLLRSLVAIGLGFALTVITALFAIGYLWPELATLFPSVGETSSTGLKTAISLATLFVIFLPLGLAAVVARKRWLTWNVLGVGWLIVLPVLVWLAWDDPVINRPLSVEELSPVFPGADRSYAVLMRYSKLTPSDDAKAFEKMKSVVLTPGQATMGETKKRLEFVTANRAGLEADWATLAPQRQWLDELNAFDRIGDLTPADPSANIITFQIWRTLSQRVCAQAMLQALDGRGDDAIATLLPVLETGRKLQQSSRYLVRSMIGVVIERMGVETANLVLDQTPVSAASRARLLAALGENRAPALARRLLLVEYAQLAPTFGRLALGDAYARLHEGGWVFRRPLNFLGGILINPNATINLYGEELFALAALAEARDLGKFAVRNKNFLDLLHHRPGMKNVGGRLLLSLAVPSFDRVVDSFWKNTDLREGLRQRLTAPAADGK